VAVEPHALRVDPANAAELVRGYDLVLDGTDDFPTRFVVNAACLSKGRTLVSGAVARWSGQVGVFAGRPCWRCLAPETPPDAETCAAVGVAGPLVGVIGAAMALEAVKLLTGAGQPLVGRCCSTTAYRAPRGRCGSRRIRPAWTAAARPSTRRAPGR
jgi:molybdopterin/thiamine biosynthesis adenylyltransferase